MTSTSIYKIRSGLTGLFSMGGDDPYWGKTGKVWKRKGDLSSHFTNLNTAGKKKYLSECAEVIEYVTTEAACEQVDAWINGAEGRAKAREDEMNAVRARWQRERDEADFERLKKTLNKV